jgi:hypothetical protein
MMLPMTGKMSMMKLQVCWCVDRWHNAGPEERKKMFALFQESGIFIASCRHRLVLLACDMIKKWRTVHHQSFNMYFSDQVKCRAKYALAIVNRLIDLLGPRIGCAYDIALFQQLSRAVASQKR